MKTNLLFLAALAAFMLIGKAHAQDFEPYLEIVYDGAQSTDIYSLLNGEVNIFNDEVKLIYPNEPERNESFLLDAVSMLRFIKRDVTSVKTPNSARLTAFIDRENTLHIQADRPLGQVYLWSTTGVAISSFNTAANEISYPLTALKQGVYILQTENQTVKLIK